MITALRIALFGALAAVAVAMVADRSLAEPNTHFPAERLARIEAMMARG